MINLTETEINRLVEDLENFIEVVADRGILDKEEVNAKRNVLTRTLKKLYIITGDIPENL